MFAVAFMFTGANSAFAGETNNTDTVPKIQIRPALRTQAMVLDVAGKWIDTITLSTPTESDQNTSDESKVGDAENKAATSKADGASMDAGSDNGEAI